MKTLKYKLYPLLLIMILFFGCTGKDSNKNTSDVFRIDYEKLILDNGLEVIFHIDRSDPVVAVSMTCHVGSARELPGRTGFAHLFEHLLFNESENLGRGGLDNLSARVGGSGANGSTSNDRTNYFQTVPSDALEKMLWAEADKLGWFINTVTEPVLEKEKSVVKNEKRQSYDNRPYGYTSDIIGKNMYPPGHPYSWQVIGSLEDLSNATLQDVKDFYNRWYVPNNVTLVVAGDFDPTQAKEWVEKYFSEIKTGKEIPRQEKLPANLKETKKIFYEDNFARLPELTIVWPAVPEYDPDSYPLEILARYLSRGKRAPLYKILVEEKKLTSNVSMRNSSKEIAGEISLSVRAFNDVDLDSVYASIREAFRDFEKNGIPVKDLNRIKAGQESSFYSGLSSVLGKANQLAHYNIFAGDPGFVSEEVACILSVTPEDVERVYNKYIKGTNFVATSFVPRGQTNLILEGSAAARISEENIVDTGPDFDVNMVVPYDKTPSSFDRSIEPPFGKSPEPVVPGIWTGKTANGMSVYGIGTNEVPLVQFSFSIKGGQLLDDPGKPGVANMAASLMNRGTLKRTPEELEEAIEELGARINIIAGAESIIISGNTLARNYDSTMALVQEMLLQPRWDESEFNLLKISTLNTIIQQSANPGNIAENEYRKLTYGKDHILSNNIMGTRESVESITIEDLKDYYRKWLSPSVTDIHVVGDIGQKQVMASLRELEEKWEPKEVVFPEYDIPAQPQSSKVYFFDFPGAKQSVLMFGYPCMTVNDPDFYPATVMNYILGGGGFASRLTQVLRQEKGYTYGIRSSFSGSNLRGPFTISSSVQTSVTLEAASLVRDILNNYSKEFSDEDLEVTKSYLIKSNARAFETMGAKISMLQNISEYGWPYDYIRNREETVRKMTVERIRSLAGRYANPGRMNWLIVGDAATQLERMKELGFGEPVLLNQ